MTSIIITKGQAIYASMAARPTRILKTVMMTDIAAATFGGQIE